ncbi:MAG: hypothetical protein AB7K37_16880 [Cyclobacteriaceae bacterium]
MSDTFITIVPKSVTSEQARILSKTTLDWLANKGIISDETTNCVPGPNGGYSPGQNYKDIINEDYPDFLKLDINGLEIINRRQVYDNGQNGLEGIICPSCGGDNIETDWGQAIASWDGGGDGNLKCSHCGNENSILDYDFNPTWGFGDLGLTFWNWPALSSTFLDDLKNFWDRDLKIIYGRL